MNLFAVDEIKRKEIFILILCFIIGFALRFYTFDQKSLWWDEIYTYNDSRFGLKEQITFYKENPTFLHPPLFFLLTHLFYPFTSPERDLRLIPLIFGTLSIPMIYLLSKSFLPAIGLHCAFFLTIMVYHISLSQEGRSYSFLMFFGMVALYFLKQHLTTLKKRFLIGAALSFALLFHSSYSSIPFIAFSQFLWFYKINGQEPRPRFSSFLILSGLTLFLCMPWLLFVILNYRGQPIMDPHHLEDPGSLWTILYWILNDWAPHAPLMLISGILLALFPVVTNARKNALVLLAIIFGPVISLYLFCRLANVTHFITSRYFITLLPLFFIALSLSINEFEMKLQRLTKGLRLSLVFLVLFTISNLIYLPLYYRSQKIDFKGLVHFLKGHLRPGDKIFDGDRLYTPGILHYFGIYPEGRHYSVSISRNSQNEIELRKSFVYRNQTFTIYHSNSCCVDYVEDGSRLWIIAGGETAKKIKESPLFVYKGFFDGSFLNLNKFPTDASVYLFLLDPNSSNLGK